MKKVLLFAVVVGALSAMTSCKKDYTCECTVTAGGVTTTTSTVVNAKKKDAEAACNSSTTTFGVTTTCAIK